MWRGRPAGGGGRGGATGRGTPVRVGSAPLGPKKKNIYHKRKVEERKRLFYERAKTIAKYKRLKRKLATAGADQDTRLPVPSAAASEADGSSQESFYDRVFRGNVGGRDQEEMEEFIQQQFRRRQGKQGTPQEGVVPQEKESLEEDADDDEGEADGGEEIANLETGEKSEDTGHESDEQETEKGSVQRNNKATASKPDPFFNEKKQWESVQEQKRKAREEREARKRQKREKAERRKQKTQQLRKRSKRGQPIMANLVSHYLEKITSDQPQASK